VVQAPCCHCDPRKRECRHIEPRAPARRAREPGDDDKIEHTVRLRGPPVPHHITSRLTSRPPQQQPRSTPLLYSVGAHHAVADRREQHRVVAVAEVQRLTTKQLPWQPLRAQPYYTTAHASERIFAR
jgi:hypothetical protein